MTQDHLYNLGPVFFLRDNHTLINFFYFFPSRGYQVPEAGPEPGVDIELEQDEAGRELYAAVRSSFQKFIPAELREMLPAA
jgi:hypothetical protein